MNYKVNLSKVKSSIGLVLKTSTYISIKKSIILKSNKTKFLQKVSLMLKMINNKHQPKASSKNNKKLIKWSDHQRESLIMIKIKKIPKMFTMKNQNPNRLRKKYCRSNQILNI